MSQLAKYRKLIAAIIGLAAVALSAGLIPSPESEWITALVALAGAAGVYTVPNQKSSTNNGAIQPPQYKA